MAVIEDFTSTVDKAVQSIQNNYEIAGTILKTENHVNYTADGAGNTIPVPVGFSPINTSDQGTRDTGFVIKNDADGNEFVWVPVTNYQRIGWTGEGWNYRQTLDTATGRITRDDLNADTCYWTETMPPDEQSSVSTYGGFYIGRYEAGVKDYTTKNTTSDGTTTWTAYTGDNTKLVIQDNQEVWNYITRDKAKAVAEGLYNKNTNNVTSKLCSSYAWDSALKFIETKNANYATNSTGGNYTVVTGGTGKLQPTGYHVVNNIYDMGGNAYEWTTESYSITSHPCVIRGGNFSYNASDYTAAHRGSQSTTYSDGGISFRTTIFM